MSRYVTKTCEMCGRTFDVRRDQTGRFCSHKCYSAFLVIPLEDRFFAGIGRKLPNGCIPWVGNRDKDGYGRIWLGDTYERTHRLAYKLFIGPIPEGLHVLHSCDSSPCISPFHLFLGTHGDNIADKMAKGRQTRGASHGMAKLTESAAKAIRIRYAQGGITQRQLAEEYGLSRGAIAIITTGRNWKHLGTLPIGSQQGNTKLNELRIPAIDCLAAEGWTQADIAMAFNVSPGNVGAVLRRTLWKHVPNHSRQLLARVNLALTRQSYESIPDPYPLFWLLAETIRRNR